MVPDFSLQFNVLPVYEQCTIPDGIPLYIGINIYQVRKTNDRDNEANFIYLDIIAKQAIRNKKSAYLRF